MQGVYIRDKVQIKSIKYKNPKAHEQKINHGLKWKNDILTLQPNPEESWK